MTSLSDIKTRNELADFLKISRSQLTNILYKRGTENCYSVFSIPKRSGGSREICAPCKGLKYIQRKLSYALWDHQQKIYENKKIKPNISHAFEKRKSIITNASIHRKKKFVYKLDLEDFFGSFHFGRVRGYFEKNRNFALNQEVATVIAQIACYKGKLPQGSPSSPIITNLICQIMDIRLLKIAKKFKMDYTRYADDLTFSTNNSSFRNQLTDFQSFLIKEIEKLGFRVNKKKTKLIYRNSRQQVTGLIVNKKLNICSDYVRTTRAMAHRLYSNNEILINGKHATVVQLESRFAYINQIDYVNNQMDEGKHSFFTLNGREKQYQCFLFYKYFYANDKPLIVTEGKTDARYIRAALKSLHLKYPNLVTKESSSVFRYKISFLKRTKRLEYFLNISADGADTMKNIYNLFVGECNSPNLFQKINGYSQNKCMTPVILLFDNEMIHDRPLKKFIKSCSIDGLKLNIERDCFYSLHPEGKLFLLTPPLPHKLNECEVEDLFTDELLSVEINGKTFSREKKYDKNKHYGKNELSNYVVSNYLHIDFSGFQPLLDALNKLITLQQNRN